MSEPRQYGGRTRNGLEASTAIAEGRRIYVGNMPYHAKEQSIKEFFHQEGYILSAIDISIDPFTGRNPSYCFVEFDEKARADQAMQELNGLMFMGRPLKIKPCVAKTSRQNDRWEKSSDFVFDRWTRTDASSHYRGYSGQGRRLRISGLPKPSTQVYMNQKLREFFKDFVVEAISKTICPHYSDRRAPETPHYAFVDFATAEEAARAIEKLDGAVGPWGTIMRLTPANRDWDARPEPPRKPLPEGTMSWRTKMDGGN
ncbi:hypothetical protein BJX62DRAFT_142466 [Aspergillus germanicus]